MEIDYTYIYIEIQLQKITESIHRTLLNPKNPYASTIMFDLKNLISLKDSIWHEIALNNKYNLKQNDTLNYKKIMSRLKCVECVECESFRKLCSGLAHNALIVDTSNINSNGKKEVTIERFQNIRKVSSLDKIRKVCHNIKTFKTIPIIYKKQCILSHGDIIQFPRTIVFCEEDKEYHRIIYGHNDEILADIGVINIDRLELYGLIQGYIKYKKNDISYGEIDIKSISHFIYHLNEDVKNLKSKMKS